jgi:hypothetical protein
MQGDYEEIGDEVEEDVPEEGELEMEEEDTTNGHMNAEV